MENNKKRQYNRGLSLIDVIIGTAIMVTVFFAVFGVLRLAVEISTLNKAKTGALSLANEQLELIRSLAYDDVGTISGIPAGNIAQSEVINLNGVKYYRRTLVQYVDAPEDGVGALDANTITADYKRVKVELSWATARGTSTTYMVSNIVPRGIETIAGGGTLIVTGLDAFGVPLQGADVHIYNDTGTTTVDVSVSSNADGKVWFPGTPSATSYEVDVTKPGYSTAQTYDQDGTNPNPNPGHLTVISGATTEATFQIDRTGTNTVKTYTPVADDDWNDTFNDALAIEFSASTTVQGGKVQLEKPGLWYEPDGYLYSVAYTPNYLVAWDTVVIDDTQPANTNILYRVYHGDIEVPDVDLPGNAAGFASTTIDISGLSTSTYPSLQIAGFLTTTDPGATPEILEWKLSWSAGPFPFATVPFNLRGDKTIGTSATGSPIYKYSNVFTTDFQGERVIGDLEWDIYRIKVDDNGFGYDIAEACPPQPYGLNPAESVVTKIILEPDTPNTLLFLATESDGTYVKNAPVRLYRAGFERYGVTSSCGQVFFGNIGIGKVAAGTDYSADVWTVAYGTTTETGIEVEGISSITHTVN